ncbi:patatin-like phospholipase family protein [Oceanicoccus sp. KOV_DT_Chl]|uniref:patatin-like phospholipase family protein n=1 Tax=Oceanicoccus sp. KOV_DT_Chl TaxID=1904639 RepID=UPI00190EA14E|nr:patatin-like phospholipase family protein [Oceanicoccus sp. KOV_DT_Chl]
MAIEIVTRQSAGPKLLRESLDEDSIDPIRWRRSWCISSGVLKAIAELIPETGHNPFQIICGTSSGAINAAKLATEADNFHESVRQLDYLWSQIRSEAIHHVGFAALTKSMLKLVGSFFHSGIAKGRPLSLFDNRPLEQLLNANVNIERLQLMLDTNQLNALCITALGYTSGENVSFYQSNEEIEAWQRGRRIGVRTRLSRAHILASSALPTIFPAVKIHREYFGDGALRQTAPMSAALHLGADKLFVIGVSGYSKAVDRRQITNHSPSLAQVLAQLMNSAFIDSMDEDLIMLQRFNQFIELMTPEQRLALNARPVETLIIEPSVEFDKVAENFIACLPKSMKLLLKIIGANSKGGGSSLASYILFEHEYCTELMACGYRDAMAQAEEIRQFIGSCGINN